MNRHIIIKTCSLFLYTNSKVYKVRPIFCLNMDEKILKEAGLSDREIDVYLTLLRLGSSLVSKISKETGLHRSNLYDTLERLKEKGLVSLTIKNNIKYYQATHPDRIIDLLEERTAKVKAILPELSNLVNISKEETKIELFNHKEGVKTVLNDILKVNKNIDCMGAPKKFEEILPHYMNQFIKSFDKLKLKDRVICHYKEEVVRTKKGEYRFLPKDYIIPTSFIIYGNKVALFIWNKPYFAIIIENKEIAETYREYFKSFWGRAGK